MSAGLAASQFRLDGNVGTFFHVVEECLGDQRHDVRQPVGEQQAPPGELAKGQATAVPRLDEQMRSRVKSLGANSAEARAEKRGGGYPVALGEGEEVDDALHHLVAQLLHLNAVYNKQLLPNHTITQMTISLIHI